MTPRKPYSFPLTSKDITRLLRNKSSVTLLTTFSIDQKLQFRLVTVTKTTTLVSITPIFTSKTVFRVTPVDLDLIQHSAFYAGNGSIKLDWFLSLGYNLYNYQFLI